MSSPGKLSAIMPMVHGEWVVHKSLLAFDTTTYSGELLSLKISADASWRPVKIGRGRKTKQILKPLLCM
jgi:hypothetical protein